MNIGHYIFHEIRKTHKGLINKKRDVKDSYTIIVFSVHHQEIVKKIKDLTKKDMILLYKKLYLKFDDKDTWVISDPDIFCIKERNERTKTPFIHLCWINTDLNFLQFITVFRALACFFNSEENKK